MSVTPVNERLAALTAAGTSVWLDQIRRGMIESGELERMVEEDSLRGVTSNPAIFEKAILGSRRLRRGHRGRRAGGAVRARGLPPPRGARRPARRRRAAPGLRRRRGGADGYVSLEVAPRLAHDTEGTLEQARLYWGLVDRPNLMIKIPATPEGIPAIEQALYEGMNVNVTLLFAVAAYEDVMQRVHPRDGAPPRGGPAARPPLRRVVLRLARRHRGRQAPGARSAARTCRAAPAWPTRAPPTRRSSASSTASASPRCATPAARSQRPLWASTGVKNPALSRRRCTSYGLVGPDTVNTMPLPTLLAAAGEGEVDRRDRGRATRRADLEALREAGIDLDDVTDQLLREGIEAFVVPMNKLLAGIEAKREAIVTGRPATVRGRPARRELEQPRRRARAQGRRARTSCAGSGARTATLWAPAGHAGGRGPPRLADDRRQDARGPRRRSSAFAERGARATASPTSCCSAWAARASRPRSSGAPTPPSEGALTLHVLDSTEPLAGRARWPSAIDARDDAVHRLLEVRRDDRAERAVRALPRPAARPARTSWRSPTRARRWRELAEPSTASAARSSTTRRSAGATRALSYFGLVPAALAGVDVAGGARGRRGRGAELRAAPEGNSGLWLGAALGELAQRGRDKLDVRRRRADRRRSACGPSSSSPSRPASRAAASCRSPTSRSPTRRLRRRPRLPAPAQRRRARPGPRARRCRRSPTAGHPTITAHRARRRATSGGSSSSPSSPPRSPAGRSEINPFDQPNVQEAKDNTAQRARRGRAGASRTARSPTLLDGLAPPAYLAIMGYLPYDDAVDAAVARLRARADRAPRRRHHVGLRPALPALDRPVPQGRPADRALPRSSCTTATDDVEVPGRALRVPHADRRAGRRRPADPARPRPARPCACASPTATSPAPSRDSRRALPCSSASSASGRWAATWSTASGATRTTRSSRSTSTRRPSRPPRGTARPAPSSLEDLVSKLDAAAHGVGDGPGRRPDASRRSTQLAELLDAGRPDRRRRQHELARRRAPRRRAATRRASTTSTSARRGGVWGLEVGYCMMVGGHEESRRAAGADPRRARAARRLAPLRRRRAPATS